ncbi:ATPase, V0 complex, subunit E [Ascosphaera apis ARSEF 7405]|uniref:ATPase, V0 complex, subunit E n=1 Tax=Ascosphaera apis ARSEF 7405 TaxID=392613 RepID=A0A167ZV79_9EURO|nr:ATPase, V0 complex, subunit E [Ascosphaera apis ARSEF 7405]
MANGWSVIVGLIVTVLASIAAWFFSPKGTDRTVWRSSLILGFSLCYIMWAITFLAQLNPLIEPRRSNLRPGALE